VGVGKNFARFWGGEEKSHRCGKKGSAGSNRVAQKTKKLFSRRKRKERQFLSPKANSGPTHKRGKGDQITNFFEKGKAKSPVRGKGKKGAPPVVQRAR